ncbi:hypothetical protein E3N88_00599 [Mikania micrantha]|uniref:Uncharacterized protein n=1 Tax=Mikania micrantha TaxID=192012 RepID=A0A5N6PZB8_9ASTR|nr:hypothetical protein E3N88_00599 [Mikania micrantha]
MWSLAETWLSIEQGRRGKLLRMDKTRSSLVKRLAVNGPKEIRPSNCCCRLHGWPKVSLEKKRKKDVSGIVVEVDGGGRS